MVPKTRHWRLFGMLGKTGASARVFSVLLGSSERLAYSDFERNIWSEYSLNLTPRNPQEKYQIRKE